jgi:hypothetical protein
MLDIQSRSCDAAFTEAQALFAIHGADMAESALLRGGASAESRVINFAVYLQDADYLDRFFRRDLSYLHALFSLEFPTAFDDEDLSLEPILDPSSPAVETICFLTDRLRELLELLGETVPDPFREYVETSSSFISF